MAQEIQLRSDLQIEAHQLSIEDLFKSFYAVPDFQREYVWKAEMWSSSLRTFAMNCMTKTARLKRARSISLVVS